MKKLIFILGIAILFFQCSMDRPDLDDDPNDPIPGAGTDFEFNTVDDSKVYVSLSDKKDDPIVGVPIEVMSKNGDILFKAFTNDQGVVEDHLNVATMHSSILLHISLIGMPELFEVEKQASGFIFEYNGIIETSHHVADTAYTENTGTNTVAINNTSSQRSLAVNDVNITYHGTYSSNGVPDYLESVNDVISADLLLLIDASLPEKQPVPTYHPKYLDGDKQTDIDVIQTADVYLTFVHEGAGWRNAIAYYTYPTNDPPSSESDISELIVLFPNLSYAGSGGGLQSGNKVHLGQFEAGTSIGLALLADGWDGNNSEDYNHLVFSNKELNPEPDESIRQHNVLLFDEENELFLVGFEDVRRDNIPFWCDQDFNDAILYFSANPIEAISTENVNPIDKPVDSDNDGVNDVYDDYPNDPNLAYNNYYPSFTEYGTLAFEDNWPDLGDYDFNDMVVDYQFLMRCNAQNRISEIEASYIVQALGAGFRNGFGFSMDISPSLVSSVSGSSITENYVTLNANGTEAGQSKATIIVSDHLHGHFPTFGFVNTRTEDQYHDPVELAVDIAFSSPQTNSSLGLAPFNPFLIVNQQRGVEVHLPSYEPTDLVDTDLLGTNEDSYEGQVSQHYKSRSGLPWAINMPQKFDYPKEGQNIRRGYLAFDGWVNSLGFSFMDWYQENDGYRDNDKLYRKN
ncbi:LruC domain-containing protein [Reichenbachiella versicolor]|uniref:LruC domain-containing protein n=1 Tax=Reichenbachiella versicolor TaxID=1821036 RepID=UPI000D6EA451|nr:LruC domain-containing protein [Reichenbachiella versicolor]